MNLRSKVAVGIVVSLMPVILARRFATPPATPFSAAGASVLARAALSLPGAGGAISKDAAVVDAISSTSARGDNEEAADAELPAVSDTSSQPRMIIRTGEASILVDSLEIATAAVTRLVQQLGGYVADASLQSGRTQVRAATLTLKVPAATYDEALGGLRSLGKVETVNTSSEDVEEEYVDVGARMANARRLEARLVTLLGTRTGKLQDVLAVERELARVREAIERFEGRLRYLRAHVTMSTLAVTVHEDAPLVGDNPSASVFVEAWRSARRNFVSLVAGVIASLGWVVPVGFLGVIGIALARRFAPRTVTPTSGAAENVPTA